MYTLNNELTNEDEQSQQYSINNKNLLIEDSEYAGLERIIVDRDSFFRGEEIIKYVEGNEDVKIYGSIISFLLANNVLADVVKDIANSGGRVELLMTNPNSDMMKYFEKEDRWHGKLPDILSSSLDKLFEIKNSNSKNIKLYLFDGIIHNTIISTEKNVIVSPYIFGKRGWYAPTLIFNRNNQTILSAFDEQLDEMKKYGEYNPEILVEIKNEEDLKNTLNFK